jgi:transposase
MASASQTKLLTDLLNIESVKVTKYQNIAGIGLILHLESLTEEAFCDRCGNQSPKIPQNQRYLVKDLPISGQPVYLEVKNNAG